MGGTATYTVDVRIIAASNTDLSQQITDGTFRRDLYFRLNVVPLNLPPLGERPDDLELLIKHFMKRFESEHGMVAPQFSSRTLNALKAYSWPGNIRELRNLCERLCILLAGKIIEPENLPLEFNMVSPNFNQSHFNLPPTGLDMDNLEASLIQQALDMAKGNRSKSARLLGLTRDTLLYRMQKHGLATH